MSWLLTAPLLVVGLLAGHAVGYWWALPDAHERAHALEESGHGYWRYLPVALAVVIVLMTAALSARVLAAIRGKERRPAPPPWLLAFLPPLAFLVQEFLERWLNAGHVHLSTLWEPAVLIGLQLQIPFALLALALARVLARAAEVLGLALATAPRSVRIGFTAVWPRCTISLASARIAARGWTERGPPLPSR
jgi:hypothetical protein